MLNCREASRLASAALDWALDAADRQVLDGHLDACPACRECARQFAALGLIRALASLHEARMARRKSASRRPGWSG